MEEKSEITKTRRKRPDKSAEAIMNTEPGDNKKFIMHSLRLRALPAVDRTNVEEVNNRITEYFLICAEDDIKPSAPGLAIALGLSDRRRLWELREGRKGKEPVSLEVADALKKAALLIETLTVDYSQNGKMNPAIGIFLLKNNHGYADEQKVVLEPKNPLGDQADPELLRQKYLETAIDDETE